MSWIALKVLGGREELVARIIKRHWGAFAYWPSYEGTKRRRGKMGQIVLEPRSIPIFPGLLWVRFKARRPTPDQLRICPSILGALGAEGKWLVFSSDDMNAIRQAATRGREGAKPKPIRGLAVGDTVKITHGAFAGFRATVESLKGAVASMDVIMFGRSNRVKIPVASVEKAA